MQGSLDGFVCTDSRPSKGAQVCCILCNAGQGNEVINVGVGFFVGSLQVLECLFYRGVATNRGALEGAQVSNIFSNAAQSDQVVDVAVDFQQSRCLSTGLIILFDLVFDRL